MQIQKQMPFLELRNFARAHRNKNKFMRIENSFWGVVFSLHGGSIADKSNDTWLGMFNVFHNRVKIYTEFIATTWLNIEFWNPYINHCKV